MMRVIALLSTLVMYLSAFGQTQYVATINPLTAILEEVAGGRADITTIVPPGSSPHTFRLRPSDVKKISRATALFYGAENLDRWVLRSHSRHRIEFIKLVPPAWLLPFEAGSHDDHHHPSGMDPHFWTDPQAVKACLPALQDSLCQADPAGCSFYQQNTELFAARLDTLTRQISDILTPVRGRRVILSHPFFRYFLRRFRIDVAAIVEPAPGKEPTPREVQQLIRLVEEEKIPAILTLEQLSPRPAQLLAEATGIKIVKLDPLGGYGTLTTYEALLLHNARFIREALQ